MEKAQKGKRPHPKERKEKGKGKHDKGKGKKINPKVKAKIEKKKTKPLVLDPTMKNKNHQPNAKQLKKSSKLATESQSEERTQLRVIIENK